jgi:ribosome-binding factor A
MLLSRELSDPRLAGVTITDCEVSRDLKHAKVFVSTLQGGAARDAALKALKRASGAMRHRLAPRLELREVPHIRFEFDDSLERGARVEELLRKVREGEPIEDSEGDLESEEQGP